MNSCIVCGKDAKNKYCSRTCGGKASKGGYRPGSGRAKTGYYKGIYCGSTYELCWVIYQLDHGLDFNRFEGFLEFNGKKYFPDFVQNNKIIEIKGVEDQAKVDAKTLIANNNGYEVVVLRADDLQEEFNYVKSTYTKNYKSLYDEYKPKFEYTCACCGNIFGKDKSSKYTKVYCSRSCSLKGNRVVSGHNQYTHREAAGVAASPSNQ